jgi:hypothetical protein
MIKWMIKAHPTEIGCQGKQLSVGQPAGHRGVRGSMLSRIDQDGRIPDRPYPRTVRDQPEEHPRPGAPFGGEALTVSRAEIAPRDGRPRRGNVALDQLGHPASFHTAERSDGLEDDQDAPRVPGQVAQLYIPFGDHYLNGGIVPAEPHRHRVRAAVLAVGRQHCRSGCLQQGPHPFDSGSAHPWSPYVDLVGSRPVWLAHVGGLVDPDGSRTVSSDRLDDQMPDVNRALVCLLG